MKRLLLALLIGLTIYGCIPCPAWAQPDKVRFDNELMYYCKNDSTWKVNSKDTVYLKDTVTIASALQLPPFTVYNKQFSFGAKAKFSTAAADTDTVMLFVYKANRYTTNLLEAVLIDSLKWGGRADTTYKMYCWPDSLAEKNYAPYFILRWVKKMGVPKLMNLGLSKQ